MLGAPCVMPGVRLSEPGLPVYQPYHRATHIPGRLGLELVAALQLTGTIPSWQDGGMANLNFLPVADNQLQSDSSALYRSPLVP